MTSLTHLMLTLQALEACRKCPENWEVGGKSETNEKMFDRLSPLAIVELELFLEDVKKAVKK